MKDTDKIFVSIIFGAVIIGVFAYAGFSKKTETAKSTNSGLPRSPAGSLAMTDNKNSNGVKCGASENTIVTKVIDGDTVVVEGGWHVRLLEIDADEKGYPCYDAAKKRLEQLVLNKEIRLEKDKTDVDIYGRCLRAIFIGDENIDLQLVKEGLAVARFYEPDVKYKNEISAAEQQAIQNKTGCKWKGI
jgi:micrococcal nuclease